MTQKPPCVTIFAWLKANLGPKCLAPLTSTDTYALKAAVQAIELYAYTCAPSALRAFADVVMIMQPSTRHFAYHAIAHVMDWGHRAELWSAAGLIPCNVNLKCAFEPGGRIAGQKARVL